MTKTIMLTSTKAGSGKSIIAIGLFLKFKEQGMNPGYFKPIGDAMSMKTKTKTDKDVNVLTQLVDRKFSKEEICPQFFNPGYYLDEVTPEDVEEVMDKITDAYTDMATKVDIMLIEGNHNVNQLSPLKLDDITMAKKFDAEVIICAPIKDDDDLNDVYATYQYLKLNNVKVAGVILNSMTEMAFARIEKYHKPLLENLGITVIGGLKNSKQLEKPTIAEIMEATHAKLISGIFIRVKNNLVNSFVIGAMGAEASLSYLRRGSNQCVITGGDRSDIALAALDSSTSLILFTGNIDPSARVKSVAEEKGIPLILAPADTFTVTEQIRKIHRHIQANEIEICRQQVEDYIDWAKIPK